jgi:hypothetical protein
LRQGSLGRNALRGFALWQVNAALRRQFKFTDEVKLILSAEAINVFNHPNFASAGGDEATLGTRFNSSLTVNPSSDKHSRMLPEVRWAKSAAVLAGAITRAHRGC